MAYLEDIKKAIRQDTDYMLTVMGGGGTIVEGFKNIIHYSPERVDLRTGRNILTLTGVDISVSEISGSTLLLNGKISVIEVVSV